MTLSYFTEDYINKLFVFVFVYFSLWTKLVSDVDRNKWVCTQESDFLNHNVVPMCEHTLIIDNNLHVFLLNIELRQNKWRGSSWCWVCSCGGWAQEWWGSVIKSQEQGSPVSGCSSVLHHYTVLTTGNGLPGGFDLGSGVRENKSIPVEEYLVIGSQEDPISSPVRSFQSLYSA